MALRGNFLYQYRIDIYAPLDYQRKYYYLSENGFIYLDDGFCPLVYAIVGSLIHLAE